jgi:hypothetical protein
MGRGIADVRLGYEVTSGVDPRDPSSVPAPPDVPGSGRPSKVALLAEPPGGAPTQGSPTWHGGPERTLLSRDTRWKRFRRPGTRLCSSSGPPGPEALEAAAPQDAGGLRLLFPARARPSQGQRPRHSLLRRGQGQRGSPRAARGGQDAYRRGPRGRCMPGRVVDLLHQPRRHGPQPHRRRSGGTSDQQAGHVLAARSSFWTRSATSPLPARRPTCSSKSSPSATRRARSS